MQQPETQRAPHFFAVPEQVKSQAVPSQVAVALAGGTQGSHDSPHESIEVRDTQVPRQRCMPAPHIGGPPPVPAPPVPAPPGPAAPPPVPPRTMPPAPPVPIGPASAPPPEPPVPIPTMSGDASAAVSVRVSIPASPDGS